MADLLDIAPSAAVGVVKINGQRLTVHSLGANALASLAMRFPDVIAVLFGGGLGAVDVGRKLFEQLGAAAGPIIAAGCGHLGDEKYEQYADTAFLLEDQLKLVTAIIRITFPNGFGFLDETVKRFTGAAGGEAKIWKVRLKKSPSPSPPSSDADSRPTMQ
jgi:hypothetical protein